MPVFKLRGTSACQDGIIWYSDDDLDRSVWVRVAAADDGRYEITELYLAPDDKPISTDDLRRIPLGRIEAWANSEEGRTALEAKRGTEPISIGEYVRRNAADLEETYEHIKRKRPLSPQLQVPSGLARYDDSFYEKVAALYRQLVNDGTAPAPAIAEANDVPVTTARRWVKEARRRGFLPPGRAGKVG